jgi:ribosomal protein L28
VSANPRLFHTTTPLLVGRRMPKKNRRLQLSHQHVPEYPYGPKKFYKQADFGLYGGASIKFGNIKNKKGLVTTKSRRTWKPNVHWKRLYSESLDKFIRIKLTARVLRTVDKVGGLDNYVLGDKPARIKELGMYGWKLRWRVLQTQATAKRIEEQRKDLGLPVQNEEKAALKEQFYSKVGKYPTPKQGPKHKKRGDVWQDDMILKLLERHGSEEAGELETLRIRHQKHTAKLRALRSKQWKTRWWKQMMPRPVLSEPQSQIK